MSKLWLRLLAYCACITCGLCNTKFSKYDPKIMELSAFYSDCDVYKDCSMFGGEVCGSDGKTYPNILYMCCINHWCPEDQRVNMTCKGPCMTETPKYPYCPVYKPCCGSDNNTYANYEALCCKNLNKEHGPNITMLHKGVCHDQITEYKANQKDGSYRPLCCSNGYTYNNIDVVRKLLMYGADFHILHDGGCNTKEVKERMKSRKEICDYARNVYQWNPVCGEDNVTYPNPHIMMATKPNIKPQYHGECNSPRHQACVISEQINKGTVDSPCLVCGSDGVTYSSIYHLECAKNEDKYLFYLHDDHCRREDNPCLAMPCLDGPGTPVCGTDGTTYVNSFALWCVQRRQDPTMKFLHDGICLVKCIDCIY